MCKNLFVFYPQLFLIFAPITTHPYMRFSSCFSFFVANGYYFEQPKQWQFTRIRRVVSNPTCTPNTQKCLFESRWVYWWCFGKGRRRLAYSLLVSIESNPFFRVKTTYSRLRCKRFIKCVIKASSFPSWKNKSSSLKWMYLRFNLSFKRCQSAVLRCSSFIPHKNKTLVAICSCFILLF